MGVRAVIFLGVMCGLVGCSADSRSPDAIRRSTAETTATAARDAKAIGQGVIDGLRRNGPVNINTASREQLMTLPGVTGEMADRVTAHRPYANSNDLLKRRIVGKAEYEKIAEDITAR